MDYLSIANSGWMWFAVAIPMAVLAAQVFLLLRRSLKDGKRMGVKEEQIKSAVIASASASVGPSVSILAGMVSLMVMMGAPIAWMRLSYIGAVMFEMTSADVGAQAVGVAFEQSSMTAEAFAKSPGSPMTDTPLRVTAVCMADWSIRGNCLGVVATSL